ncbi:MAG TPA: hypothetical protein VHM91_15070 [Verrucomicrobiales bacterium]|nr:hypothetical protein [Verrucomicrobiales bacterium]
MTIREITSKKDGYSWTTYLCQGWIEDGKWKRKKFKSRQEAEIFKLGKELELATDGEAPRAVVTTLSAAQARDAEKAVSVFIEADMPSLTLTDAATHYLGHVRRTVAVDRVSFRDALSAFLEDKERGGMRDRTSEGMEGNLEKFIEWLILLDRFHAGSVDTDWTPDVCEITAADVGAFLNGLRTRDGAKDASPKTWNNYHGDLHTFFEWCLGRKKGKPLPGVTRRWHTVNPAVDVSRKQPHRPEPAVLSVQESVALMKRVEEVKSGRWAPYFALCLFAGIRPGRAGEITKLANHPSLLTPCREASGRPLIDMERRVITITRDIAKTRSKRVIPMQPCLHAWLTRYGFEILGTGSDDGIKAVRAAANLGHDVLRHSFISYHIGAFQNIEATALQAGNSVKMIRDHYLNHPSEGESRQFWNIIPVPKEQPESSDEP